MTPLRVFLALCLLLPRSSTRAIGRFGRRVWLKIVVSDENGRLLLGCNCFKILININRQIPRFVRSRDSQWFHITAKVRPFIRFLETGANRLI